MEWTKHPLYTILAKVAGTRWDRGASQVGWTGDALVDYAFAFDAIQDCLTLADQYNWQDRLRKIINTISAPPDPWDGKSKQCINWLRSVASAMTQVTELANAVIEGKEIPNTELYSGQNADWDKQTAELTQMWQQQMTREAWGNVNPPPAYQDDPALCAAWRRYNPQICKLANQGLTPSIPPQNPTVKRMDVNGNWHIEPIVLPA